MTPDDELLMAYADGELDSSQRAQVEAAMRADPELARRVASHRALRERVHSSFNAVLQEPVPERLLAAARARDASPFSTRVIPLRQRSVVSSRVAWWGSMAASFLLGALGWYVADGMRNHNPVLERDGRLLAIGRLERTLNTQLASTQPAEAEVRIGSSFRDREGRYCRTFQLQSGQALAGLACREQQQWQVTTLASAENVASGGYRQAASGWPAAVTHAVDAAIAGEPLDAQAEAQALASGWQ